MGSRGFSVGVMRSIPHSDVLAVGASPRRRSRLVPVLAVALAASTVWAAGTSYYILFHDEMLGRFFAKVRTVQLTYEARVGDLQSQVDRAVSERIQSGRDFEGRFSALAERQALIETRQGLVSGLGAPDPETTGSIPAAEPAAPAQPQKPFPTPDSGLPFDLRMRGSDRVEAPERRLGLRLAGLDGRLDRLAARQSQALGDLSAKAVREADRLRALILRAGLDPSRFEAPERGIGGPLVPVSGDAFDLAFAEARRAAGDEARLRRAVTALPFRRPLTGDAVTSSEFGARLDPFTRALALHTGLDLRADHGTAARATAAGRVTAADYAGGYGNMVEIDHGRGVVTRYAHLAGYAVVPGQRVEAGAIVGRVGSTGRSTGNHLHYEVRIDGEPVDPQRFLAVAASLDGDASDPEPSAGLDTLSTESWLAWSRAQLQTPAQRK